MDDVEAESEESASAGPRGGTDTVELSRAEQTAARRVAESKATIPHLYLRIAIAPPAGGTGPALWVKAAAAALREHQRLNATYRDGRLELHSRINVGVGITGPAAFALATVFDAETKSIEEIAAEIAGLTERAKAGTLTAPELGGATFGLLDLSAPGIASVDPVIQPSHAGALGLGAPGEHGLVLATLACDHRAVDPASAARFLERLREIVEAADSNAL